MQQLSHLLRKTMATKKLSVTGYMGVVFHVVSDFLGISVTQGVIKYGIVYLKIEDHGKKMILFREKKGVLNTINTTLKEYGYGIIIKDIKFR